MVQKSGASSTLLMRKRDGKVVKRASCASGGAKEVHSWVLANVEDVVVKSSISSKVVLGALVEAKVIVAVLGVRAEGSWSQDIRAATRRMISRGR